MTHSNSIKRIVISTSEFDRMRQDVAAKLPEEGCGLLIGKFDQQTAWVEHTFPMTNILHSPTRYLLDPREQYEAFRWLETNQLELAGIYHSHPYGPPHPSETDTAEAFYPEACYLIWSNCDAQWSCRAFVMEPDGWREIAIHHQDHSNE